MFDINVPRLILELQEKARIMVETERMRKAEIASTKFRQQAGSHIRRAEIIQLQNISPAAVFLASVDSGWITRKTF